MSIYFESDGIRIYVDNKDFERLGVEETITTMVGACHIHCEHTGLEKTDVPAEEA